VPQSDVRTVLYLVRHGEADSNRDSRFGGWSPAPLTDLGQRQAAAAASELRRRGPTVLVTSDLARAHQTAAPIAAMLGLEPRLEPGVRERSLGVFDGLTFADAEARVPDVWQRLMSRDPAAVPEGGESADVVFARVSAAIQRILTEHAGERIAVVTHGLALFHVFAYVCGLGSPSADLPVFVLVDNASITQLERRNDRWRIVSINDTAHLRDLTES
jgi:probable phosphoglycerate mutase